MSDANGSGEAGDDEVTARVNTLRDVLDDAVNASGSPMSAFTVLSPQKDPYRLDVPENHRCGEWFARMVERFVDEGGAVHLRGLHYRMVAAGDVIQPDGEPYINTDEAWIWMQTKAAKAGRLLGYVDFDRISDERNAAPELFVSQHWLGEPYLTRGTSIEIPTFDDVLPEFRAPGIYAPQPFRIILIGEKTSLKEVLSPIAEMVGGELLLPTGEASDTMIAGVARRAGSRPCVVLYFSDFDPSGYQMPISVARKLQALHDLCYPDLNIQVHQAALTLAQVRRVNLPSTPLKATELRGDRWRAVMQHEQTEIDALAALRPQELREIALEAIKPFYDSTLRARSDVANFRWRQEAQRRLAEHPDYQSSVDRISDAHQSLEEAASDLQSAHDDAQLAFRDIELPPVVPPEPEIEVEAPDPLFTTANDFATATRRLIAHKTLDD